MRTANVPGIITSGMSRNRDLDQDCSRDSESRHEWPISRTSLPESEPEVKVGVPRVYSAGNSEGLSEKSVETEVSLRNQLITTVEGGTGILGESEGEGGGITPPLIGVVCTITESYQVYFGNPDLAPAGPPNTFSNKILLKQLSPTLR